MAPKRNALQHLGSSERFARVEDQRQDRIREAAYYKAMNRRFAPGCELVDWLAAEKEVDSLFGRRQTVPS